MEWSGLIGALLSALGAVWWVSARLARLELRLDIVWQFIMRRAMVEALQKGVAVYNSPFAVTAEARAWMVNLAQPLHDFYRKLGRVLSDDDLALEIERRFGEQIVREVCVPHGLTAGACLLIAVALVRGGAAPAAPPPSPGTP